MEFEKRQITPKKSIVNLFYWVSFEIPLDIWFAPIINSTLNLYKKLQKYINIFSLLMYQNVKYQYDGIV